MMMTRMVMTMTTLIIGWHHALWERTWSPKWEPTPSNCHLIQFNYHTYRRFNPIQRTSSGVRGNFWCCVCIRSKLKESKANIQKIKKYLKTLRKPYRSKNWQSKYSRHRKSNRRLIGKRNRRLIGKHTDTLTEIMYILIIQSFYVCDLHNVKEINLKRSWKQFFIFLSFFCSKTVIMQVLLLSFLIQCSLCVLNHWVYV